MVSWVMCGSCVTARGRVYLSHNVQVCVCWCPCVKIMSGVYARWGYRLSLLNSSETQVSFAHNIHFSCQITLKFCTEHGSITAMLCAKFKNDWMTELWVWSDILYCSSPLECVLQLCLVVSSNCLGINPWLSARLGYLQCICIGDTTVLQ